MESTALRLTPHPAQSKVLRDNRDIVTIVAGRGFGKSYLHRVRALMWSLCFDEMMRRRGQPGFRIDPFSPVVSAIVMPTQKQVRAIHWIALENTLSGHPLVRKLNRSEMRISFYGNRPDLVCLGANDRNGDGLRGFNFVNLQLDEYQDFRPNTFELVLMPAMTRVPGHQCLVTGTPKGKLNIFYNFAQTYGYHHFVTLDNPTVDPQKVLEAQATLPEAMYRQEYLAAWEDFSGKFYSELGEHNRTECDNVRFNLKVLGVDHGDVHPAHVVWGRDDEGSWWYLDGWSPNTGLPIPEDEQNVNLVYLAKRYNIDMCLCDPSRPSRIITIRALGGKEQLKGLRKAKAGFNKVMEGIAEVHSLIHQERLWVPTKRPPIADTVGGIPASMHKKYSVSPDAFYNMMQSYHRAIDRNGTILDKVADGQFDHICFTGNTPIITEEGYTLLSQLNVGDRVLTPLGYKPITHKGERIAKVLSVDGYGVTPEHPVWCGSAWQPVGNRVYNGYIQLRSYPGCPESHTMGSNTLALAHQFIIDVLTALQRNTVLSATYIEQFMWQHMGEYLKATTSTTLMAMQRIMSRLTWQQYQLVNTMNTIIRLNEGYARTYNESIWVGYNNLLRTGTVAQKVSNGTDNTGLVLQQSLMLTEYKKYVNSVAIIMESVEQALRYPNSAIQIVRLRHSGLEDALVQPITVSEAHCFYVGRDLSKAYLASNCDASRYSLATGQPLL